MRHLRLDDRWKDDSKIFLGLNIKERILATIYGGIIGDFMGVPVEFKARGSFHVDGVTGYGTYNQPPGTWSDDTSLTLCLIENIAEEASVEDLMKKFVKYKDEGYMTPFGHMFDIGRSTADAIERFKQGTAPEACGGKSEYDNGNGAIMRISPVAFLLHNEFDFQKKADLISKYTKLTHGHPRSIVGSIIYVELLLRLFHNTPLPKALKQIEGLFHETFAKDHVYMEELTHFQRMFEDDFLDTPKDNINSDGYVVHTLEAAIWCVGNTGSYKEAILEAINLGDDTDTVAAITGSLAGMIYYLENIPEDWLENMVNKDMVDALLKRFYENCANKAIIERYGSL